jgi:hypothetical protein
MVGGISHSGVLPSNLKVSSESVAHRGLGTTADIPSGERFVSQTGVCCAFIEFFGWSNMFNNFSDTGQMHCCSTSHHNGVFSLLLEIRHNAGHRFCDGLPKFWADYYIPIYTHLQELLKLVGSHGSSSLLFLMKVTIWHFVSKSHKVMTALIVILCSNYFVQIHITFSLPYELTVPKHLTLVNTVLHCPIENYSQFCFLVLNQH